MLGKHMGNPPGLCRALSAGFSNWRTPWMLLMSDFPEGLGVSVSRIPIKSINL